jgi:hypothetical protein
MNQTGFRAHLPVGNGGWRDAGQVRPGHVRVACSPSVLSKTGRMPGATRDFPNWLIRGHNGRDHATQPMR